MRNGDGDGERWELGTPGSAWLTRRASRRALQMMEELLLGGGGRERGMFVMFVMMRRKKEADKRQTGRQTDRPDNYYYV